jgi:hypothetical protein
VRAESRDVLLDLREGLPCVSGYNSVQAVRAIVLLVTLRASGIGTVGWIVQ